MNSIGRTTPVYCFHQYNGGFVSQQADVYLASALISPGGYANGAELFAAIAQRHQLAVLLANHVSTTGGWQTCGNSGSVEVMTHLHQKTSITD